MREIVITNLRIVSDARSDNATKEAHDLIRQFNEMAMKIDGSPIIFISHPLMASYRENPDTNESEDNEQ